jgi:hypothetical protein
MNLYYLNISLNEFVLPKHQSSCGTSCLLFTPGSHLLWVDHPTNS